MPLFIDFNTFLKYNYIAVLCKKLVMRFTKNV